MKTFNRIQSIEVVMSDETAIQELGKLNPHPVEMYRGFRSKGEDTFERIKKSVRERK
jgi:hypothetical protein